MYSSVLILVALCLTSLVLGENIFGDKGTGCTLPDERRGVCKPSSECHERSISSSTCSTQRDIIYVCCEVTKNESDSYVSTGRIESPGEKHNEESRAEDDTNDEELSDRHFYNRPSFQFGGSRQIKDERGGGVHYNNYNNNEGWNSYQDRDVYSFDIKPSYEVGYNSKNPYDFAHNTHSYQWSSLDLTYPQDQKKSKEKETVKYPWETPRRTTERLYNFGYNNYEDKEDQEYPWETPRRTTERPNNPGYNNYEYKEDQKYPWETSRRTTRRPNNPGYNNYEYKEDQKYPWETSRRTTRRPNNPGYNNYEDREDQKYPWNSHGQTTERPRTTRWTTESSNKVQRPTSNSYLNFPDIQNRKRISEIKCGEYSKLVTQTISGLPLVPNPSPIEIKLDECKKFQSLIVGGKNTTIGEFPHMAAVGFLDSVDKTIKWFCGGSLISDRYVLTAAHCVNSKYGKPVKVRLGEYNLIKEDDGAHPEDHRISEVFVHPDYKQYTKYNDIALLKLSTRVNIRKDVRPACLQTKSTIHETRATALGWGRLERAGNQSDVLQKVTLDIIDRNVCNKAYSSPTYSLHLPRGIVDTQLCAGELFGNKDTCQGDSGGPLEVLDENNRCIHYILGLTSFGKACATANSPGVYTRVSSYIPWIEGIVWPGQ